MGSRTLTFVAGFVAGAVAMTYVCTRPLYQSEAKLVFLDDDMIDRLDALDKEYHEKIEAVIDEVRADNSASA